MILKTYRSIHGRRARPGQERPGKDAVIILRRGRPWADSSASAARRSGDHASDQRRSSLARPRRGRQGGREAAAGPAGAGPGRRLTGASLAASAYRQAAGQPAAALKPAAFFPPEPKPDLLTRRPACVEVGPNSGAERRFRGHRPAPLEPQSMPVRASRLATRSALRSAPPPTANRSSANSATSNCL